MSEEKLLSFLESIFTDGEVKYSRITQHNGKDGYERLYWYEDSYYIMTGVGTNGFIISAYPIGEEDAMSKIRRYGNNEDD